MPQSNEIVGRKTGKLLQGLLMGLYGISGVEANPEFLSPGTEGPVGPEGNMPFKGTGLFGGLKAKGANAEYVGRNALADAQTAREIAVLPKRLSIENAAALDLARGQNELAQENALVAKNTQGRAIGTALAQLPNEQLSIMGVPQTFSSPAEQADWYNTQFGQNTAVVNAPALAAKAKQDFVVDSSPEVAQGRINQEYNRGLMTLGTGKLDRQTGTVYNDAGLRNETSIELVKTGNKTIDANGNLIDEVKEIPRTIQVPFNAFTSNLENRTITQADADNAAAGPVIDIKAEDVQTPQIAPKPVAQTPELQGLLPSAGRAISGVAGQALGPALETGKTAINSLATGAANTGNLLNNARKLLIRGQNEQMAPMIPDPNGIMSSPFPWLNPLFDLEAIPIITNEAINPTPNPLPIPPDRLIKYLQNRAINAGRQNYNLQSR